MKSIGLRSLIPAMVATLSFAPILMADLGSARSYVVLSSSGSVTFKNRDNVNKIPIPGSVTCPGAAGCTMRIGGGGATDSQGLNCTGKCEVDTVLPDAGPDAAAFSAFLAGLPATQTLSVSNLGTGGSITITASSGLNVITVPAIVIGTRATLTISGSSAAMVVINVGTSSAPGVLILGNGSSVLLAGGITPDKVIFNVEGSGDLAHFIELGNKTTFNGTILAPQQGLISGNGATTQPIVINGALLFGQSIFIGNNVNVNFFPLAQMVIRGTGRLIGTVDVGALPPPVPRTGPLVEGDRFLPGPNIEGVPGQPGPPATPFLIPLPPRRSAAIATPARQSASDPLVALQASPSFTGLGNVNRRVPPDTQVAAGVGFIVELVNQTGAVYDKATGLQVAQFDLAEAFSLLPGTGVDPRMLYDAPSHTFFIALEKGLNPVNDDFIYLAVASDPISAFPRPGILWPWSIYTVKESDGSTCFDQPKLGVSDTLVTLSWNDYDVCSGPNRFLGSETITIKKEDLLLRNPFSWNGFGRDSNRFGIVPVQSLSPSGGVQYAVYHNVEGTDIPNLHVMAFTGTPPDVGLPTEMSLTISQVFFGDPPGALQPRGNPLGNPFLKTNDTRLVSAVWQNNNLWTAFNDGCRPEGDTTDRACIHLLEVATFQAPEILGGFFLFKLLVNEELQGPGLYVYYPAVTLSAGGDLFFAFTESSTTLNPVAEVIGVLAGNFGSTATIGLASIPSQFTSLPYFVTTNCPTDKAPDAPDGIHCYINRWGDYSGAAPDPVDPTSVWVGEEFSQGDWSTAIAKVSFAVVAPSGLVSWWKGEGNAADVLGNNPGTLVGTVNFVAGKVGQAFSFQGTGFVEVAASPTLQPAAVTAMAWVRHLGVPGANNYVLSQGAKACSVASYALYTSVENLFFGVSDGSTFAQTPDAGPGVWDGNWHLVAGTYDGAVARLYVDGVEVTPGTPTPVPIAINTPLPTNQNFYIGAFRGTCELRFNGDIDEVRIFNRALSAAEIQSIFSATP